MPKTYRVITKTRKKGRPVLRIITGTAKGKKLITLEGEATRPTSERIKEAVFSSIQFDIEGRKILDLFAGSGQMGLEALSRGGSSVKFVDSSREAVEVVKKNAQTTGFFDRCKFVVSDYRNYIRKAKGKEKFDLVFIDPPYAMECSLNALNLLAGAGFLNLGCIAVLESGTEEINTAELSDFEVLKSTRYGKKTFVNILIYRGNESDTE